MLAGAVHFLYSISPNSCLCSFSFVLFFRTEVLSAALATLPITQRCAASAA